MASPKSTSDEIPIGSGSGGRLASKNCPGFRATLPKWVSRWKRCDVERVLHIFYEQNTSGMAPQLLENIPKMKKITSEQKKYIEILRNTNFGPNLNTTRIWTDFRCDFTKKELNEALLEAKSKETESLLPKFGPLMHIRSKEYFAVLQRFVDHRRQSWTEEKKDEFKEPCVFEEEYSFILSAFAKLCGLWVEEGFQGNQAQWINLRGNEIVISRPDFRFHATGQNFDDYDNENLLTVIEVEAKKKKDQKLKRKQQDQSEIRAKRRRTTSTYSSSTSTSTSTSTCELQSSTVHAFQTGGNVKPYIQYFVPSATLGQHAGELLLDLNKYVKSLADISTTSILYMPGMIVDHTTVYLTLLEISAQHFKKLTGTEQPLTRGDKATIYCSEPLDIMEEKERRILIGAFVNLNNIESLLK